MQTIKILNEDLINKIAAGEVIESPKSAVKELVENSLDAKSTNIKIEIRNAGLSYIKVDDDGCGISNQDAILAFQRHATSKIESFDDLNIVHLGDLGQSKLTEDQVAQIGETDILLIPVGSVYTINSKAASDIVSQLEPKIIIPMHYKIDGLKFELDSVDGFLKEMGAESVAAAPKLTITKEKLPEEPQVVVLNKS